MIQKDLKKITVGNNDKIHSRPSARGIDVIIHNTVVQGQSNLVALMYVCNNNHNNNTCCHFDVS